MEGIKKKFGPLSNLEFDKLFLGQILSHFADAIVQFLLIALLMQISGSAGKSIATMFFVFLLPQFLISPFSGILCDRFSRKTILSLSTLIRAITVAILICFLPKISPDLIYIFTFILGLNAAFFYPAKMSAVTNIVESAQLKFANALTSSIGTIALLFGAFIANYLTNFKNTGAFFVVGAMYFISSMIIYLIKFQFPQKYFKKQQNNDILIAFDYLKT